jgi:tetratricopeptide (TPR) repeat protein
MDFLTPGEKIKKLRIDLNMNQQDLEDEGLTRAFVSMIELGKRGLSRDSAKIIVDKFNGKAKKLDISFYVDEDYILSSPAESAQEYCLNKLKNLENENEIEEIVEIAKDHNLYIIIAEAFKKLGDIQYNAKDYTVAFISYSSSLDANIKLSNVNDNLFYLNNRLGCCRFNQLMYKEAIFYFGKAYSMVVNNGDVLFQKKLIFNLASCYKKMGYINKSIEFIDKYLLSCDKEKEVEVFIRTNMLKAVCYTELKDSNKAEVIYNELINDECFKEHKLLANVYNNLGLIYLDKKEYLKSLEYFNKSQQIRSENKSPNLSHTLIEKAEVYKMQGLYTEAIMIINLGIEQSKNNNDLEYLIKGHYKLSDIYNILNDNEKLEEEYKIIIELLEKTDRRKELIKIYNKMCMLFLNTNNVDKAKTCLNKSMELLDED